MKSDYFMSEDKIAGTGSDDESERRLIEAYETSCIRHFNIHESVTSQWDAIVSSIKEEKPNAKKDDIKAMIVTWFLNNHDLPDDYKLLSKMESYNISTPSHASPGSTTTTAVDGVMRYEVPDRSGYDILPPVPKFEPN